MNRALPLAAAAIACLTLACEGPEGPQGPVGPAGDAGPPGEQGAQGERGEEGPAGAQGEVGERGPEGSQGTPGAQGPAGAEGPAGADGEQGDPGEDGEDGAPGEDGEDGAPGRDGADGRASFFTDDGLVVTVDAADVDDDGHPVLTFRLEDAAGHPLDADGFYTEGSISLAFTAAVFGDAVTSYITREVDGATQATSEADGELVEVEPGGYVYTYALALPEDADRAALHRFTIGARRSLPSGNVGATAIADLVPEGDDLDAPVVVDTDLCNACHKGLEGHGGRWTEVGACVTCHTAQTTDPDTRNTVEYRVMIHKIHQGAGLPSVQGGEPYRIIGYRGSVHDFSHVAFPRPTSDCAACHVDGSEGTNPWGPACAACHDRTSFTADVPDGWEAHSLGPQEDTACGNCHAPSGNRIGVAEVHRPAVADPALDLEGLSFAIVSVEGAAAGGTPTVRFTVTNGAGERVDLADLDSLEVTVAGPTTGFAWSQTTRNAQDTAALDGDEYTIDLAAALPDDATGSVAVGMAGYRYLPYGAARADSIGRENGGNPVVYVALDGGDATPPAEKVDEDLCNACHGDLALHGTFRDDLPYCGLCHNQNATDAAVRPEDAGEPESIYFGTMIHRIHAGGGLQNPLLVYGFGGSLHDYSHAEYPAELSNCQACHTGGWREPSARACTSCHDSAAVRAHTELQTTDDGVEACAVCHSEVH